jgi:hypothetical protein
MSNVIDFQSAHTRYVLGLRPLVQDFTHPSFVVPSDRDIIRDLSAKLRRLEDELAFYKRKDAK